MLTNDTAKKITMDAESAESNLGTWPQSQQAIARVNSVATPPCEISAMLTVDDVGAMLKCSSRTVYRLSDKGRIPKPVRLGHLVRWPLDTMLNWTKAGCPHCRTWRER